MPMRRIFSFVELLSNTLSQKQLEEHAAKIAEELGFKYYSLVLQRIDANFSSEVLIQHNYPTEWELLYFERNYFTLDPTNSRKALEQPIFRWPTNRRSEVMDSARDFGIQHGVTSAVRSKHSLCWISFSGFKRVPSHEALITAQFIAPYISSAVTRISGLPDGDGKGYNLSAREKECLRWVCAGKTSWEISKILSISERTVLFHLSNIQTKLETCNRAHSVAKSTMLGLLDVDLTDCHPCFPSGSIRSRTD